MRPKSSDLVQPFLSYNFTAVGESRIFEKSQLMKNFFLIFWHETWWAYSREKNKNFVARNFVKIHFPMSYVHLYVH